MATVLSQTDSSSTALTINSTSWTQATTISTTAADLSASPNAVDVLVTVAVTFPNSAMGAQKSVNIWVSGSEDGTIYDENDQYSGTNNTQTALRSPSNFKGPIVLAATINIATAVTFSLRQVFGGVLPRKFGLILENQCNQTITTKSASYTSVNFTNT